MIRREDLALVKDIDIRQVSEYQYERLIYISHPYAGLKENEDEVAAIINKLQKIFPTYLFISPIHAFSYDYTSSDYRTGLERCLYLLEKCCTECWVFGDWKNSIGVQWEIAYCDIFGIPCQVVWGDKFDINTFLSMDNNIIKDTINNMIKYSGSYPSDSETDAQRCENHDN